MFCNANLMSGNLDIIPTLVTIYFCLVFHFSPHQVQGHNVEYLLNFFFLSRELMFVVKEQMINNDLRNLFLEIFLGF